MMADTLYQDGVAAAVQSKACPHCPEAEVGYADELAGMLSYLDEMEAEGAHAADLDFLFDDYAPMTFNAYGDAVRGTDTGW